MAVYRGPELERVMRATGHDIGITFYVDGTPTDPDPDEATIVVNKEDGTELIASTAAIEDGVGKFKYTLTPTHTVDLEVLTAQWTATVNGVAQTLETHIKIVGGHLFTIADARAMEPLDSETDYPTANLVTARVLAAVQAALDAVYP